MSLPLHDHADSTSVKINPIKESLSKDKAKKLLSFVIPVKDEEETLFMLHDKISANVPEGYDYEVIFIDDGSKDRSWSVIESMSRYYPYQVRGLRFRSNVGKAAALTAGFRAARGEIVFTMDGDLQDDPKEIPRFLEKLAEGYDVVSGYKKIRHDPWHKVLPSRVFNRMLSYFSCVKLHDHNCGFKCCRTEFISQLTLHGELHRMVPSLAGMKGFRVGEIIVNHHPRDYGCSKYGAERYIRGFSDMMTIGFLRRYRERPAHFMNAIAFGYLFAGVSLSFVGMLVKISSLHGTMFFLVSLIFFGMAFAVFLCGLVCEQIIRGGNDNSLQLPIVKDTADKQWQVNEKSPFRPVPTKYAPGFNPVKKIA